MTLVEFLTARFDEDEAEARADRPVDDDDTDEDAPGYYDRYFAAIDLHKRQPHGSECAWRVGEGLDHSCSCDYPARVLREVEAKRAIVALAILPDHQSFTSPWVDALLALAAVYSNHPDYREEWRA